MKFSAAEEAALEAQYGPARPAPVRMPGEEARQLVQGKEIDAVLFIEACRLHGLGRPIPEFRFHPDRKWRFDWAWPAQAIALEIDGGAYSQGRHTRGKGFIKDQEKRNEALLLGWKVFHCVPADVKDGRVFELLKRALR